MSTENELNENELWELLKEPIETETKPEPKKSRKKEEPQEEKPKTVITEKRKKALVWYLAGLFGIAFIVVLISLFFRGNPGNPSSTTPAGEDAAQVQELYDRINALEEENNELKAEKATLETENQELLDELMEQQEMMDNLKILNDELSASIEYVEGSALYSDENSELRAKTMKAYELLTRAQNAFIDYNEEVLNASLLELEEYLDLLSQEALNAYFMVIEYMEQPYLGQE